VLNINVERQEKFPMDKFDFKKAIKNNIASSQKAKTNHILNEARITRNVVKSSDLSLVESLSLLSEEEILMEQLLAEGEEILSEDFGLLNEGLWSKVKKFTANMIKKDWFTSGGDLGRKMEQQYQKIMEKTAGGLLKKFMEKFNKTYPEFPNMEDKEEFGNALVDIATFYDSIKHITLTPKDVENQPISIVQKEIANGKLDARMANEIIGDLRAVMMKFIDNDLSPIYKSTNEELEINEEEDEPLSRAYGGNTKSMKRQKSLKLPAILGLIGGTSVLASILVNMGWFSNLFTKVVQNPGVDTVKDVVDTTQQVLSAEPGEGFTQMMGRLFLGDVDGLGPNATVGELLKVMKENGVTPEKLAEISDKGKELFLQDWENTIANADPSATLGDTLGANGLGAGGNLGLALGKKAVYQFAKQAGQKLVKGIATATVSAGVLGVTAPAAATTLALLGAGLAAAGLASYAMRKKSQKSSRLQKLQDLRDEFEDLPVPEELIPAVVEPKEPEEKEAEDTKVPAEQDIKMGDWVRYTNDKGQKMLVRISNRMDLNPIELQEADRPAKWGGRFQADVMINLDTGRVSFSGPYALETKDAEKAEDSFVEKTKQSNPKIQRAIDRVEARKSKEDAEKPSDEENAEKGEEVAAGEEPGEADDIKQTDRDAFNYKLLGRYLASGDEAVPSWLKKMMKKIYTDAGIPWKDEITKVTVDLMKGAVTDKALRSKMASQVVKENLSRDTKQFLKSLLIESIRSVIKNEIKK
jgi:hypothetical protein